jgi:hypothetical protein
MTEIFDDGFLDRLFDLVEETRTFQDDSLNFSVVKLIVSIPDSAHKTELTSTFLGCAERTVHGCGLTLKQESCRTQASCGARIAESRAAHSHATSELQSNIR